MNRFTFNNRSIYLMARNMMCTNFNTLTLMQINPNVCKQKKKMLDIFVGHHACDYLRIYISPLLLMLLFSLSAMAATSRPTGAVTRIPSTRRNGTKTAAGRAPSSTRESRGSKSKHCTITCHRKQTNSISK